MKGVKSRVDTSFWCDVMRLGAKCLVAHLGYALPIVYIYIPSTPIYRIIIIIYKYKVGTLGRHY